MHTFRRELDAGDRRGARRPSCASARGAARRAASSPAHPDLAPRALALPVATPDGPDGGLPQAWLVAAKDAGGLAEIDRLILHQAVTVVALELLRRRVADTTERRLAGDVLSAAIARRARGRRSSRGACEPFGLGGPGDDARARRRRSAAPTPCEAALGEALRGEAISGLVAQHGRFVCALLPGFLDEELVRGRRPDHRARRRATGAVARRRRGPRASPAGARARELPRGALRARGARADAATARRRRSGGNGRTGRRTRARRERRHLPRPRVLPAAALAAGLRRAARSSATRCSARSRTARATTAAS